MKKVGEDVGEVRMWYPPIGEWVRCYLSIDKVNCKFIRNDFHGLPKHQNSQDSSKPLINDFHSE
jgi:hypothetical protein